MPLLIREAHNLIFDGRTIPRPGSLDVAGEQRRPVDILPDDFVGLFVCVREVTHGLLPCDVLGPVFKGKRHDGLIAALHFHLRIIDGSAVDAGGGSGLKPKHLQSRCYQRVRQLRRPRKTVRARILAHFAVDTARIQIHAAAQNHCLAGVNPAGGNLYPGHFLRAVGHFPPEKVRDFGLL